MGRHFTIFLLQKNDLKQFHKKSYQEDKDGICIVQLAQLSFYLLSAALTTFTFTIWYNLTPHRVYSSWRTDCLVSVETNYDLCQHTAAVSNSPNMGSLKKFDNFSLIRRFIYRCAWSMSMQQVEMQLLWQLWWRGSCLTHLRFSNWNVKAHVVGSCSPRSPGWTIQSSVEKYSW